MQDEAAADLGQQGGTKGGPARAANLTPERRIEIAKRAAAARWGNVAVTGEPKPVPTAPPVVEPLTDCTPPPRGYDGVLADLHALAVYHRAQAEHHARELERVERALSLLLPAPAAVVPMEIVAPPVPLSAPDRVRALLADGQVWKLAAIQNAVGCSYWIAYSTVADLVEKGALERVRRGFFRSKGAATPNHADKPTDSSESTSDRILRLLSDDREWKRSDLLLRLKVSPQTLSEALTDLIGKGYVEHTRKGHYQTTGQLRLSGPVTLRSVRTDHRTPAQRSRIGRMGAMARWHKAKPIDVEVSVKDPEPMTEQSASALDSAPVPTVV